MATSDRALATCGDDPWIEVGGQYLADGAIRVTCQRSVEHVTNAEAWHRWDGHVNGRDVRVMWEVL